MIDPVGATIQRTIRRLSLIALTGAAAIGLVWAAAAPGSTDATGLVGTTGPRQTITLKKDGKDVVYLRRGRYTITVRDRSSKHNFALRGPWVTGVSTGATNRITSLRFFGRKTAIVTLKPGLYYYFCSAHGRPPDPRSRGTGALGMGGSFRVT